MRVITGILLLGVAFAKRERCGRNARYTKCGTACPLTCDNIENPPDFCGTMCIQGCQCEEGFVQSRTFGCVEPEDCPKSSSHVRRICLDQPDAGFCGGRRMMWNFNRSTGTCHQFRFGGCGGNGNRYRTEEECLEKCKAPPQTVVIKDGRGQLLKSLAGPYDEGTSLVLVCETEGGNPAPVVTWWKNGVLIDDTFSQTSQGLARNELVILKLQRSDFMTELTCQAFNKNLTSINASVKIDLNMKPLYVRITTAQKPINLGEDLTLECETSGSRPEAKIVWWMDNELIKNKRQSLFSRRNGSEGNVTYSSIHLSPGIDDKGKAVICKAENPALPHIDMRDTWILNIHYNVCGKNERYNECGTHCPLTCENYDIPDRMCPDVCDEGCECENGFVRRADGRCVRLEDCRKGQDEIPEVNCNDCPDTGECETLMTRFYYDSEEESCKEFIYGGCGGNTNNFETEEDCKATCRGKVTFLLILD
ncbi:hypothetical protein AVEN_193779-1 [Araneus ventricosus]|uniref:Papilin n=1 Tax=Araneus ventricosus TaxID=182803 RepID=A0A4Y2DL20_ARAVE|nr:hypothetical protein AVEN_193779-1 [Araneus ventricosus]